MSTTPSQEPARPQLLEREAYKPFLQQEEFITPAIASAAAVRFREWARAFPGARILDVGCGGQPFRAELEALGFIYHGLDTQQNRLGTVHWLAALDEPLPTALLESPAYDLILSTELLEHVFDWTTALANVHSLLRPGGQAFVTVPFVYPLHEQPYDFWRPTPFALERAAKRAGLRVLSSERLGTGLDVLGLTAAHLRQTFHYLTPRNLPHRVAVVLRQRLTKGFLGLICAATRWSFLRRHVGAECALYVGNAFLLER